jgi:hypothetical protein
MSKYPAAVGVQIHAQDAVGTRGGDQVGDELR